MGLQSTGVATTDSLPTEGVPLVEQLRRVGRDDEGGQGGVSGKRKNQEKKGLSPAAVDNVESFATFIVAP